MSNIFYIIYLAHKSNSFDTGRAVTGLVLVLVLICLVIARARYKSRISDDCFRSVSPAPMREVRRSVLYVAVNNLGINVQNSFSAIEKGKIGGIHVALKYVHRECQGASRNDEILTWASRGRRVGGIFWNATLEKTSLQLSGIYLGRSPTAIDNDHVGAGIFIHFQRGDIESHPHPWTVSFNHIGIGFLSRCCQAAGLSNARVQFSNLYLIDAQPGIIMLQLNLKLLARRMCIGLHLSKLPLHRFELTPIDIGKKQTEQKSGYFENLLPQWRLVWTGCMGYALALWGWRRLGNNRQITLGFWIFAVGIILCGYSIRGWLGI